jgi:hypothetical protein
MYPTPNPLSEVSVQSPTVLRKWGGGDKKQKESWVRLNKTGET